MIGFLLHAVRGICRTSSSDQAKTSSIFLHRFIDSRTCWHSHQKLSTMLTRPDEHRMNLQRYIIIQRGSNWTPAFWWRHSRPISAPATLEGHGPPSSCKESRLYASHVSLKRYILIKPSTTAYEANVPSPRTTRRPVRKHSNNAR